MKPLITICVPTFNRLRHLEILLPLLKREAGATQDVVIFVSDNASTDGTWEYLNEFASQHIGVLLHRQEQNVGAINNARWLIENAPESEYLWIFGDDDRLIEGALDQVISLLKTWKPTWLHMPHVFADESGKVCSTSLMPSTVEHFSSSRELLFKFHHWLTFISASILERDAIQAAAQNVCTDNLYEPFIRFFVAAIDRSCLVPNQRLVIGGTDVSWADVRSRTVTLDLTGTHRDGLNLDLSDDDFAQALDCIYDGGWATPHWARVPLNHLVEAIRRYDKSQLLRSTLDALILNDQVTLASDGAMVEPDSLVAQGEQDLASDSLLAAEYCFHRALALQPHHLGALNGLTVVRFYQGYVEIARALAQKALLLFPGNPDALHNLEAINATISGEVPSIESSTPATVRREHEPPMVSVIVPTYHRPDGLAQAIRSILAQTYQDFEIVVVNDAGSPVEDVIVSFAGETRITYIRHPRNKGLAAARNTGIRAARGRYIAYLDDDDRFYPNHLETLVSFLEASDYQVAYTDAYRVHQKNIGGKYVDSARDLPYSFDFDADRFLVGNYIPVLCFMHARTCLSEVGYFDERMTALEDWDLWLRLSRKFEFMHLPHVTCEFTWREDGSSMTSSGTLNYWRMQEIIYDKYRAYSEGKPEIVQKQEEARAWMNAQRTRLGVETEPHDDYLPNRALSALLLPGNDAFKILTSSDDNSFPHIFRTYVETFTEGADVTLHVLCHNVGKVETAILKLLAELGRDAEHIPDVSLLDTFNSTAPLSSFILSADLVVGSDRLIDEARALAVPALRALDSKTLKAEWLKAAAQGD